MARNSRAGAYIGTDRAAILVIAALLLPSPLRAADVSVSGLPGAGTSGPFGNDGGPAMATLPPPGVNDTANTLTVQGGPGGRAAGQAGNGGDASGMAATTAPAAANSVGTTVSGGPGGPAAVGGGSRDAVGGAGGNVTAAVASATNLAGNTTATASGTGGVGGAGTSTAPGFSTGQGGAGGGVAGVAADATASGNATARADAQGGLGGVGTGIPNFTLRDQTAGGSGGLAGGTTATARSTGGGTATALVSQAGGEGGGAGPGFNPQKAATNGPNGVLCMPNCGTESGVTSFALPASAGQGGAGSFSSLLNAVTGYSTGTVSLGQAAIGGPGGASSGPNGTGGLGGAGTSDLTFVSTTAASLSGNATGQGGTGGAGFAGSSGGRGGDGTAIIDLTGPGVVFANASAIGGQGGANRSTSLGLVASSPTDGANGIGNASAHATTTAGQTARALALGTGAGGILLADAVTSEPTTGDSVSAQADGTYTAIQRPFASTEVTSRAVGLAGAGLSGKTASTLAPLGAGSPPNIGAGGVIDPTTSDWQAFVPAGMAVSSAIATAVAAPGGAVLGLGTQQMVYAADRSILVGGNGVQTLSDMISFTFGTAGFPAQEELYLGTVGSAASGTGFDDLAFTADKFRSGLAADTVVVTLTGDLSTVDQAFSDSFVLFAGPAGLAGKGLAAGPALAVGFPAGGLALATAFFSDPVYDLGLVAGDFAGGTATAVPEPPGAGLLAGALVPLAWRLRLTGSGCSASRSRT